MFVAFPGLFMRALSTSPLLAIHVAVFLVATSTQPAIAQSLAQSQEQSPAQLLPPIQVEPAAPPPNVEAEPPGVTDEISPQFNRYLLGAGDVINVAVERPTGLYRLGPGDAIAVTVQRFPDLSFQAIINPEGNIVIPLLGTVSLQGLTLQAAQEKIRRGLNRFVVDPIVTLALVGQRPDLSFQAQINPEGNILVPQIGTLSIQGLTLEEAQEKIRLALSKVAVDPVVSVALAFQRPVQITVVGEVFRPGIYPVASATPRVVDAVLLAGGSTTMADLRQVQVRRKLIDGSIVSQNIDLYTPLQSGRAQPNLRLQDGDAIIVPRRELGADANYDRNLVARSSLAVPQIRIRILNYSSGGIVTVPVPNGSTFVDALVGINLDTANLREIRLFRFDAERGRAVSQTLDARKALQGDVSQNVPLQDNDVIVVGRNLIARISSTLGTITRPFFDVQSFIRFFEFFGGGDGD